MHYTRNSDLTYYEQYPRLTNCGSYALRLKEWYDPSFTFAKLTGYLPYDWLESQSLEGYSDFILSCMYRDILIDCLLVDFKEELEICDNDLLEEPDTELIAFNTFCTQDEYGIDYDFHFKVFRNGTWKEKSGATEVKECDEFEWGEYIGEAIYLKHKIKRRRAICNTAKSAAN